jgi:hypothetical protein
VGSIPTRLTPFLLEEISTNPHILGLLRVGSRRGAEGHYRPKGATALSPYGTRMEPGDPDQLDALPRGGDARRMISRTLACPACSQPIPRSLVLSGIWKYRCRNCRRLLQVTVSANVLAIKFVAEHLPAAAA